MERWMAAGTLRRLGYCSGSCVGSSVSGSKSRDEYGCVIVPQLSLEGS